MGFQDRYGQQARENVTHFLENMNTNIVSCGQCGEVFGHRFTPVIPPDRNFKQSDFDLTCPFCHTTDDPCHFPDIFY